MQREKCQLRYSLVGKLFQGESIELQVTMLSHGLEASYHIITSGATMPEKNKNLGFLGSYFVYSYYFIALKITPTQSVPL